MKTIAVLWATFYVSTTVVKCKIKDEIAKLREL